MQDIPSSEPVEVRPGLILGRYELLVPIAAGGMAQVWAARMRGARQFQKIVAVKTMLPKLSEDAQFEQMFLDEASLASQIRHPNAVEIMDLGEQHGVLYLVMEWIEGVPLNQLMKASKPRGGIPLNIASRIALQVCAGLHAAHELKDEKGHSVGLVHRDVSPQNLLVTYDGVTKVVDFGVAKATALGGGATQAGQVKGKVSYMSPEQVNGEGIDRRADIFALGIVLYALTTGKHPFRRESEAATMYNICSTEPVVPPSSVVEGYPRELEAVVLKSLAKDRTQRYKSCDEMLRALDGLPPALRVSSDADVATFVQGLLSERQSEQRRRIDEAIRAADAASGPNWAPPGVAAVDGRPLMHSGTGTHDISGLASGVHPQTVRNRWLGVMGLIALAISGGIVASLLLRSEPQETTVREVQVVESGDPSTAAPEPAARPAPPDVPKTDEAASGVALEDLPEAEEERDDEAPSSEAPPAPSRPRSVRPHVAPRPVAPRPQPKPKAEPPASDNSWKYDAGF